jgi:hypothetical protein
MNSQPHGHISDFQSTEFSLLAVRFQKQGTKTVMEEGWFIVYELLRIEESES